MLEDRLYPLVRLYQELPGPVATAVGAGYRRVPERLKFGAQYLTTRSVLEDTEQWDPAALADFQWAATLRTLRYAARKVPWYGRTWAEHGVRVAQLTAPEDLALLPTVSKQDVRDHWHDFISVDARPRDALMMTTSGSTGEPLRLLWLRGVTRPRERAYIEHLWRRAGYRDGERLAMLRALLVHGRAEGQLWRRDAARNRWIFSTFDMTSENCRAIVEELRRIQPVYLHVYASALSTLCSYMIRAGVAGCIPSVRAVFAGSENFFPWQRDLLAQAFGEHVQVVRWYGMGEHVSLAGSCECSQAYHVFSQYSFTELLRDDGTPARLPGEVGEIVGTAFDNWVMPFIRYRTADRARLGPERCACGRPYTLWDETLGRSTTWVVTAGGDRLQFAPALFASYGRALSVVRRFQFEQREPGVLDLWLVPWPEASLADVGAVVRLFEARLVPTFELRPHVVKSLEQLPGGKHEYLVQRLAGVAPAEAPAAPAAPDPAPG